ncbi:ABC transporter substrate-binding protein [Tissierella sp. Yu-01]|uniref:ABC transporter substrate-binding protein n=1 Tax=Tissierella sp. Yu-01 TaxID=3035694 RepID=UPI00240E6D73|nr:ABC transporter substrate-binding protein [Tissierella sp. Yu-01]WFA09307.1 ABC transporter substrate-binding protein [Tissierella sp. Yu-01]
MKKIISILMVVIMITVAFTGCTNESAQNPELNFNLENENSTKKLSVGVVSFADTLEPTEQYFSWVVMRYGVGETLVKFNDKMDAEPWLAKNWGLAEDNLTWTFEIREDVKFSNGNEMTAESVKNSLERTFELSKRANSDFFQYDSIEVEGNNLIIKTKAPTPGLPGCLADPLFIIVDTTVDTSKFAMDGPICTGPYVVTLFDKEKCVVVKNEHYWDGEVPYDEVTLIAIDDVTTRAMSLQSCEIDMAVNISSSDLPIFEGNDDFHIHTIASLRTVLSFMNQEGPLNDIKVRQAVIKALNRQTYADVLLNGTFESGKAPIPSSLDYGFDQLKDKYVYDLEGAKQLIKEAGYVDSDDDGFVEKDGEKLTLQYVIYDSRAELPLLAEATQLDLKEIGIDVKIENYEYTTLLDMQETGEYDLLIWNVITANTGDPENYLREYWKTKTPENDNSNTAGYSSPELDKVLDTLSSEFDVEKRKELIISAQQIIMDDAASIFYAYPETNIISNKRITGVRMFASDYYWLTKDIKPAE